MKPLPAPFSRFDPFAQLARAAHVGLCASLCATLCAGLLALTPAARAQAAGAKAAPGASYQAGDQVWVHWSGTSQRARILQSRGDQYLIRYEGYDSKWDEWIGPQRIAGRITGGAQVNASGGVRGNASSGADTASGEGADRASGEGADAPGSEPAAQAGSGSPVGRWECATWDAGQLNRIGGFTLRADGSYQDQNSRARGQYVYRPADGRIAFVSGPQKTDAPIHFQPQARQGAGMIRFDYGGGARLDCYRAAGR